MVATTNVPPPTFTTTGLSVPAPDAVLAGEQADMNAAYGGNLDFVSDSAAPQVQWSSSIAAIISNVYAAFLFLVNQFNPTLAFGRYQDALGLLYNLVRDPAEPTVVQVVCTGAGVTIPVGALTQDTSGNVYQSTAAGTIPVGGGSITLPFQNIVPGPTPCEANTLTKIYQAIPGWDTVNNPTDGVIGQNTETQQQFETRRQLTLQANANNTLAAVRGVVLQVPGVLDCYTTENDTSSPVTIGGFTLVANSMYVAVVGGLAASVAQAIWSKKAPGCAMNGNTTVAVQDTRPPYQPPYPTTNITWETPSSLPVFFQLTLINGPDVPADAAAQCTAAIQAVFAGTVGVRPRIGSLILATNFYAALVALGTWVRISSLLIGSPNFPGATFNGSISGTTLTVNSVSTGVLVAGQFLDDGGVNILPGTQLVSGGPTTWTITPSYGTVSSENMTATAAAASTVQVGIAQSPTFNPSDFTLVLV